MKPVPPRLPLRTTLAEALSLWPAMAVGAGGVLALTAILWGAASWAGGLGWAVTVVSLLVWLVAWSAVTRIGVAGGVEAARATGLGPQGFQIGRPELRLFGAVLLLSLFFAIILSLLGLTALALFGAAGLNVEALKARDWAGVGPMWKLILLALIGVALIAAPLALMVRVSLFAQATIARGRMTSLGATAMTNGSMWPLFAGLVMIAAPGLVWLVVAVAAPMSAVWALIGWGVIQAGWQAPLTAGFLGAAWRRLERNDEELAPL
ncbi:hypothetical protein BH10PSE1_BH10PSE1_05030 [soil metagenome]